MNLELKVNEEIKKAMLAKNEVSLRSLRAIKASILLVKASGNGDLTVDDEVKLLQKLVKQRKDALEIYETQNRPDLAKKEKEEIEIIENYLPEKISTDDLRFALKQIIIDMGATTSADMGKIMAIATKKFSSQTDGKTISLLVKELLLN